jgi:hypothetical protein
MAGSGCSLTQDEQSFIVVDESGNALLSIASALKDRHQKAWLHFFAFMA